MQAGYKISLPAPFKNKNWIEEYYNESNNISNIAYNDEKALLFASKKLSRNKINKKYLINFNNFFFSDDMGNIFAYSLENRKIVFKYNFYKKHLKKIKKRLNIFIDNENIIVSDNVGYVYSINYLENKVNWAKNFGIPFYSNIKVKNNLIFLVNENNKIYFLDKFSGEKIFTFTSESVLINTSLENNIAIENDNLFFLNSGGKLHSFNIKTKKLNWVLNLKKGKSGDSNLFNSKPLTLNNGKILSSANNNLTLIDANSGKYNWTYNIISKTKPVLSGDYAYVLTKKNLLMCINSLEGNIVWSKNLITNIRNSYSKKIINKLGAIEYMSIVENKIVLISKNSYYVEISPLNSKILKISKIKSRPINAPIFVNGYLYFLDKSKKILVFN